MPRFVASTGEFRAPPANADTPDTPYLSESRCRQAERMLSKNGHELFRQIASADAARRGEPLRVSADSEISGLSVDLFTLAGEPTLAVFADVDRRRIGFWVDTHLRLCSAKPSERPEGDTTDCRSADGDRWYQSDALGVLAGKRAAEHKLSSDAVGAMRVAAESVHSVFSPLSGLRNTGFFPGADELGRVCDPVVLKDELSAPALEMRKRGERNHSDWKVRATASGGPATQVEAAGAQARLRRRTPPPPWRC